MATAHFRGPKPYTPGADFSLWRRRFESYARAAKIPQDQLSDALLALLDDAAFRAFDLLGLTEAVRADYKQLFEALSRRFASTTGEPALRFQLGQRYQEAAETLDEFANALLDLANRAYPELDSDVRMHLARDRFVAGMEQTIFKRISYKHLQTRLKMRAKLPNDWRQPGLPGGRCRHRTKLRQYTRLKATLIAKRRAQGTPDEK